MGQQNEDVYQVHYKLSYGQPDIHCTLDDLFLQHTKHKSKRKVCFCLVITHVHIYQYNIVNVDLARIHTSILRDVGLEN